MRKIHLTPALINQHQMLFDKGGVAYYPIRQSKITTHLLPQGISSFSIPELCSGVLPKSILVGIVDHLAFNGELKKSPWIFQNCNINGFTFKVNGMSKNYIF